MLTAKRRMGAATPPACQVRGERTDWPACALRTPPSCVRRCEFALSAHHHHGDGRGNGRGPPVVVTVHARRVLGWGMTNGSVLEAGVPPPSPACAAKGACSSQELQLALVPFGSTDLRVAAFPVA